MKEAKDKSGRDIDKDKAVGVLQVRSWCRSGVREEVEWVWRWSEGGEGLRVEKE